MREYQVQREWQAVATTEVDVVREMARCLRELAAGASAEVIRWRASVYGMLATRLRISTSD